jgi:sialic acid synthase SpsE
MKYADFLKDFKRNVFIIAEIGVNHEGDIDLAKRMILSAKENGADAVKFQTYKADKIASKNSPGYWDFNEEATRSQYELFKKYDTFSKKEYQFLKDYSEEVGVEFMSTPFDLDAVEIRNSRAQ